jgi:hypothetical protein
MAGHPDLEAEQAYIDAAYASLEASRVAASRMTSMVEVGRGGTNQARYERDVIWEAMLARLSQLELGNASLCFGRIDLAEDRRGPTDRPRRAPGGPSAEPRDGRWQQVRSRLVHRSRPGSCGARDHARAALRSARGRRAPRSAVEPHGNGHATATATATATARPPGTATTSVAADAQPAGSRAHRAPGGRPAPGGGRVRWQLLHRADRRVRRAPGTGHRRLAGPVAEPFYATGRAPMGLSLAPLRHPAGCCSASRTSCSATPSPRWPSRPPPAASPTTARRSGPRRAHLGARDHPHRHSPTSSPPSRASRTRSSARCPACSWCRAAGHRQDRRRAACAPLPALHLPVPARGPGCAGRGSEPAVPRLHRAGPAVAR